MYNSVLCFPANRNLYPTNPNPNPIAARLAMQSGVCEGEHQAVQYSQCLKTSSELPSNLHVLLGPPVGNGNLKTRPVICESVWKVPAVARLVVCKHINVET